MLNSCVDDESTIPCFFPEYRELGRLKVLCAESATLNCPANIIIDRKSIVEKGVTIHGELEKVIVGQYCFIGERTVLKPPPRAEDAAAALTASPSRESAQAGAKTAKKTHSKLSLGSHVICGADCVIEAYAIGSFVRIGDGCIIGAQCVIKDCCLICPGAVLPPFMIVPPFAIVEGNPARIVGELPESTAEEYQLQAERTCRRREYQRAKSALL